jgi:hypothetical protein
MSANTPNYWAIIAYQVLFTAMFLSYALGSLYASRQLRLQLAELWPTFNSTNGEVGFPASAVYLTRDHVSQTPQFETTLKTLSRLMAAIGLLTLGCVAFSLISAGLQWSPNDGPRAALVNFCVWQSAEAVIVWLNLLAFAHLNPERTSKDGLLGRADSRSVVYTSLETY